MSYIQYDSLKPYQQNNKLLVALSGKRFCRPAVYGSRGKTDALLHLSWSSFRLSSILWTWIEAFFIVAITFSTRFSVSSNLLLKFDSISEKVSSNIKSFIKHNKFNLFISFSLYFLEFMNALNVEVQVFGRG